MEGSPLTHSNDPEGFDTDTDTDTKKSKDRRKKIESRPLGALIDLDRRRHIAREAMRHEESPAKQLNAEIIEFPPRPKPVEQAEEPAETAEAVDPDETLDAQERLYAAQALRRESQRQRHEEPVESEVPPVIAAGDLMVDEWDDRIEDGQDPDEAMDAVLAEHHIPPIIIEAASEAPLSEVSEAEPTLHAAVPPERPHDFADNEVVITPHDEREESGPPGGGEEPPQPPEDRSPFESPLPPSGGQETPRLEPASRREDKVQETERYTQANAAGAALLGGIIGYFIGRRRGRIRTEKKLLPIQKKLEKEVVDLNWELKAKEAKIRRIAAEHVQQAGPEALQTMTAEAASMKQARREQVASETYELPSIADRLMLARSPNIRRRAPEARQLHSVQEAPGHIGHVLVSAESRRRSEPPKQQKERLDTAAVRQERLHVTPDKHIETLSRPELMSLSDRIIVEGNSLRQIYETHLIGEQGLRRLVQEYIRGGDVQKALQREIVEHEIDFERDPALRDMAVTETEVAREADPMNTPGKEALNQLLQKAEEALTETEDQLAYYKARTDYEVKRSGEERRQRRTIDTVMTLAIVALVILVVALFFWHR